MSEPSHGAPSPRAEVERYQQAIDFVRDLHRNFKLGDFAYLQITTVATLAQERVAELSRRAEAAELDETAWRNDP